jgi:hypothetical protein
LLLSAAKYQPTVVPLPQKSWQFCSAEWVKTAAMLAVTGCLFAVLLPIDAHFI